MKKSLQQTWRKLLVWAVDISANTGQDVSLEVHIFTADIPSNGIRVVVIFCVIVLTSDPKHLRLF